MLSFNFKLSSRLRRILKVIFFSIAIWAAYDVYLVYDGGSIDTISFGIWAYAQEYPMLNSLMSALLGHFFWTIKAREELKENRDG